MNETTQLDVRAASDPLDNESGAFERPDYLRSRYDRDATRHKPGSYQKSGHIECQSQLVWWLNYIKQSFKGSTKVGDRLFLRRAIANRAHARAQLGRGAPNTVLILLDDVGHVNDTSHDIQYGRPWSTMARPNGLPGIGIRASSPSRWPAAAPGQAGGMACAKLNTRLGSYVFLTCVSRV